MSQNDPLSEEAIELAHKIFDAARAGQTDFIISAVRQGVPVDLTDANGNTLLMLAAYNGWPATVAALAEAGADVNRCNDRGQSPLAGAVFKKELETAKILLKSGADPDAGTPSARDTAKMFGVEGLIE